MSLAEALSKAKGSLKQAETRVTLRDGRQFVEKRDDQGASRLEYVGEAEKPDYIQEEEKGFSSVKPARFSSDASSWSRTCCDKQSTADQARLAQAGTLRVVTFNVWFADKNFNVRARLLFDLLEKLSPDVICLQEVTPRLIKLLVEEVWVRDCYWISDCTGVTVTPYGVLMMSRLPVHKLALHLLPTNMGRRALVADLTFPVGGKAEPLRVATVHLESLEGQLHRSFREAQLKTLFPLLADCTNSMVMGDFNFDPSKPEQHLLDPSYTDVWRAVHSDDPGHTFREYPVRIDRMMIKSSLGVQPSAVDLLGANANPDGIFPSDHLGMCCDFHIP